MHPITRKTAFLSAVAFCCLLPLTATAQQKTTAKPKSGPKPALSAEQVLEKYVEATGGKAAYARITSMMVTGTVEIPAQNIKGSMEMRVKSPDKIYIRQSLSGIGDIFQGYDGKIAWSKDPFNGLRTLEGTELGELRRQASMDPSKWKTLYKRVEMIGYQKVGNANTYAIKFVPVKGNPNTQYYDTKTFFLVKMEAVQESPQGTIPVESILSDYKSVDGIKMPFQTTSRLAGAIEIKVTLKEVKNNIAVDDAVFAKPEPEKSASDKPAETKPVAPAEKP